MTHLAICRLDAYASEEFEELARAAEELLDAFATGDAAMSEAADEAHDAYLAAMRLELSFFEQVPGVPALAPPPASTFWLMNWRTFSSLGLGLA